MNKQTPASTPKPRINVAVQWATQADHPPFSQVSNALVRRWVRACFADHADITIRFVGAIEGRALNNDFRNKDYATNVLTFPMSPDPHLGQHEPHSSAKFSADIVICPEVIEKEAIEQGKEVLNHLAHIIIHGCLHAQGYDHGSDEKAEEMEALEVEILKGFQVPHPYKYDPA